MKITKTTTKTYEIYDCARWEMTVGDAIQGREKAGMKNKGLDKCFCCEKKFQSEEIPFLALIRNYKNMFICEKCAEQLKESK